MAILFYLILTLHIIACLFLIAVVLLQQGKGADLSVFGGGGSMATFGARGATTLLHRLTVGSFVAFILTTLGIAILQGKQHRSSVMAGAPTAQTAPATTPTATPAP